MTIKSALKYLPLTLLLAYTPVQAEKKAETAPVPPPPAIPEHLPEQLEDEANIKADVTIRKGREKVIEEYRVNGELYLVKVTPKVGKPYYIRYPEGKRRELDDINTPFWKLFEW